MYMKKCTVKKIDPPPPPDPCKLQRMRQKEKTGIKFCPKPPIVQPPPPPDCLGVCIEKVKNPPVPKKGPEFPIVCTVEREVTTQDRCDEILERTKAQKDIPWPGCPAPPVPPPKPKRNLCEEQERQRKIAECKERFKRYYD